MSELVLVRHGRTEANARGLLLGRRDVPLDATGGAQARAVAAAALAAAEASGRRIAAVVSSPLRRARQTAAAFGLPVEVDDRFVELDYGELDGVAVADVPASTWAAWRRDPHFAPPGGETLASVAARVAAACEDWAEQAAGASVVVVTHVSPLKAAVAWALGVDEGSSWRTRVDPGSISRVVVGPGGPVLGSFNETGHLVGLGG